MIYTDQSWWDTCTADSTAFTADPLWIASYAASPVLPAAWANSWAYWQYTSNATVPGVSGSTDASWLSSTALELTRPANQSDATGSQVRLTPGFLDGTSTAATFGATGLPAGVTIDQSTGVIGGRLPAKSAAFPISVTAAATGAPSVSQTFTWDAHGKVSFGRLASQGGSVASPASVQLAASDGLGGCTLRYSASGLPRGLAISSCGLISGWPAQSGQYRVTVSASDGSGTALAAGRFGWTVKRASGRGPAGQIRLRRDAKCLEARSGTDIAIGTCTTWSRQRWTIAADGTLRSGSECLAAAAVKTGNGKLSLTACGGSAQRWHLGPAAR